MDNAPAQRSQTLPVILVAAVVQGLLLYGLHVAIQHDYWPATNTGILLAIYAVALFIPLTIQLLADHARSRHMWTFMAILSVALLYVGWHHGSAVYDESAKQFIDSGEFAPIGLVIAIIGLQLLPFLQARLATGGWQFPYSLLFATAWRNMAVLAEAALFTGLLWLLLLLWQALFSMIGIEFFKELFQEPVFIYPVTTLTFGVALHLMGSLERMTSVLLEQLLNLLKWLAVVAGLIMLLFAVALIFKLPGLIASGQKAIGAGALLALIAVYLLLVNAAFRDGSTAQPYPKLIGQCLRFVVPLMTVISLTAIYALYVRTQQYGLTVDRFWGWVVAGSALVHSVGYTLTALKKQSPTGHWLPDVGKVNVVASICLMTTMLLALTPILSPYRLAANSQHARALDSDTSTPRNVYENTPYSYLRFEAGRYGRAKLQALSELQDHPRAQDIRKQADKTLAATNRWEATQVAFEEIAKSMRVFPVGRTLDESVLTQIAKNFDREGRLLRQAGETAVDAVGLFTDFDADGIEELAVFSQHGGLVYRRVEDRWEVAATLNQDALENDWSLVIRDLERGNFTLSHPRWKDLSIGSLSFETRKK